MISETTVIQRNDDIVETEIDGELVMMSIENGAYYGLGAIAKQIWQLIETPLPVISICSKMLEEYEVEKAQCIDDVITFLNSMAEHNVIKISS